MARTTIVCLVMLVLATNAIVLDAQINKFSPFKRNSSSNQKESIELNEKHGPWLVMCASFGGDEGLQQAKALVHELRNDYKLSAYIYTKQFDFSGDIYGLGWEAVQNENGEYELRQPKMTTMHRPDFEYAVLVGDFPTPDDGRTQKSLERIKHIKPRCLEVSETVDTNQRMGVYREIQRQISPNPEVRERGPMRSAFVMPNPMIPSEYFQTRSVDQLVVKMNKGLQYSLYKCPQPFSVRVATFRGDVTLDSSKIEWGKKDMESRQKRNQPMESKLAEAADKAHTLTVELRKNGIEAYEFHDRNESYVCVGSFPWATRKLANGKDELNPEVEQIILRFKARVDSIGGMQGAVRPKSLPALAGKDIFFDIQPLPVMVPKLDSNSGILSLR